jgi:hypothetical protein
MKLFSEKVTPTFTNSSFNILQVENFSEIFFDVYEIELNKIKYPVEKISSFRGNPVVSVPVVIGEKEQKYPFILTKGNCNIIFNENNIYIPSEDNENVELVSEQIIHEVEPDIEGFEDISIPEFEIEDTITEDAKASLKLDIAKQLKEAKKTAAEYAEKIKSQKINEATQDIKKRERVLKNTLDNAKADLVSEFVDITKKIREDILKVNNDRYSEISQTVDNKIVDLAESLRDSISDNFSDAAGKFEKSVSEFVTSLHENSTLPEVRKNLTDIASDIVSKVSSIEQDIKEDFYEKLENKADADIVHALQESTLELNSTINKGLNKALSRVGNTNNKIDKVAIDIISEVDKKIHDTSSDIISQIDEKIEIASSNISDYYSDKLKFIEEQAYDLNEKSRKYVTELVQESRDGLIKEIRKLQKETPVEYVIESSGKREVKSFDSINSELDKKISSKISDEVIRLKKFIAVYSSGGGSVAQQFADGGTMNGNLTVVGTISASQYLGIPVPRQDFLPLSGGVVTGNVSITGTLSATMIEALSANITVIDIKQYELSGFNVQGDATVQGSISASGSVFGNNIVYNGGNTTAAPLSVGTNTNQNLIFETNSLSRMTIASGGFIGIGTATPSSSLEISGVSNLLKITHSASDAVFLNRTNSVFNGFGFQNSGTEKWFIGQKSLSESLVFRANGANDVFTIDNVAPANTLWISSGGNVGIGTSTPNERLTVSGNISASGSLSAGNIFSNGNRVATVVDPVRTTLSGNGILSSFAISGASGLTNPSALIVAIDGALQEPVVDYTVSGGNITFSDPLPSGSKAVVISPVNSLQVSQMIPADGSVTSAKLDSNIEIAGQLTAPNQTLNNLSDVVTRNLGDSRYLKVEHNIVSPVASTTLYERQISTLVGNGTTVDITLTNTVTQSLQGKLIGLHSMNPNTYNGLWICTSHVAGSNALTIQCTVTTTFVSGRLVNCRPLVKFTRQAGVVGQFSGFILAKLIYNNNINNISHSNGEVYINCDTSTFRNFAAQKYNPIADGITGTDNNPGGGLTLAPIARDSASDVAYLCVFRRNFNAASSYGQNIAFDGVLIGERAGSITIENTTDYN